jgi:hypothetical protein
MRLSCGKEESRIVAHALEPQGMDDTHPQVREGAQRHAMAFALAPFPAIVRQRPLLLRGGLPSKLVQGVAPRLDASPPLARPRKLAALIRNGSGSRQRLALAALPKRSRSSPHPESNRGARRLPVPGRLRKT